MLQSSLASTQRSKRQRSIALTTWRCGAAGSRRNKSGASSIIETEKYHSMNHSDESSDSVASRTECPESKETDQAKDSNSLVASSGEGTSHHTSEPSSSTSSGSESKMEGSAEKKDRDGKAEEETKRGLFGWLHALRIAVLDIVMIAAVPAFVVVVTLNMFSHSRILEKIEVPKSAEEHGLAGGMISERLADEVQKLQTSSSMSSSRRRLLEPAWEQADIQIPGGNLSLHTISTFLKAELGTVDTHVSGELSLADGGKMRLTIRDAESREAFTTKDYSYSQYGDLVREAAWGLVRLVDPATMASFWFAREIKDNRFDRTMREISNAIGSADDQTASRAFNLWGNILSKQGTYNQAILKYLRSISLAPKFSEVHTNLGDALYATGQYERALQEYRTAIHLDAKADSPYTGVVDVLIATGRVSEARREAERAVANLPYSVWMNTYLGEAYQRIGDTIRSRKAYDAAAEEAANRTLKHETGADADAQTLEDSDNYFAWLSPYRISGSSRSLLKRSKNGSR
jgi:tetratricopeptide (TPR) repeat protein